MVSTAPQTLPLEVALQQAIAHHQAGRLQEAEQLYRAILQAQPRQAEANHNLGTIACQVGQHMAGLPYLQAALSIKPDNGQFSLSYAEALLVTGRAKEAQQILQSAMLRGLNSNAAQSLKKRIADALRSPVLSESVTPAQMRQIAALFNAGQIAEMESAACALVERHPHSGFAWKALGTALLKQRKDSLHALQKAAALLPKDAQIFSNIGNVLQERGRHDEALQSYRRALEIDPDFVEGHFNLGRALQHNGQLDETVQSYRRALSKDRNYVDAHTNLGNALMGLGQLVQAMESYRRVLEIKPKFAEGHYNLGKVLQKMDRLDEALVSCRRALEINPEFAEAHSTLGNVLFSLGQMDDAVASFQRALKIKPDAATTRSNLLYSLQFTSAITALDLFEAHKGFSQQYEAPLKPHWRTHTNSRDLDKRLKLGYVSGDLRQHAVASFIEPVLTHHDKTQVEVFCYANSRVRDAVTSRLMAMADRWQPCAGMSDDELAQRIRADGIDILVDLAGHTANNRLLTFARKPAPIQITYLGYLATSGLTAMDYRLTDRYAEAEGAERYHTEQLLRLPDSQLCYRPPEEAALAVAVAPLPALSNGYLTFGSFNNINRVSREAIELWASLLRSLPSSRLQIVAPTEMHASLTQQFEKLGIARQRVGCSGRMKADEFRRALQQVDITLDTCPHNGVTTTCESLWQGVPVLNLVGDGERFLSRNGLSILSTAGLPEFAAATQEEYIQTATMFANDLPRLAAIRAGMRERLKSTPLLDQQRFTRNLEGIYRDVWRRYAAA